jgi:general secretion pathway protein K
MLAEFQDETSVEIAAATAQRDEVQAEYMARSAVNLARLLIASEPTMRQAIAPLFAFMKKTPPQLPVWEFSDRLLGAFNDEESSTGFARTVGLDPSLGKNLGMPGGRWELTIVDEDAKINVNLGAQNEFAHIRLAKEMMGLIGAPQYDAMFSQRDGSGQYNDRLSTCQALIDWADSDEQAYNCDVSQATGASQSSGVEDNYYALLPKPYRRKNAPYDSLEELHMVRGVSEDFWGTFVDPDPSNPKKRVMTVWGQGAVNVNTANAQTLLAVVCAGAPAADICTNADQAATFLAGVTMAKGITMGAPLFGSTNDFVATLTGKGQLGPVLTMLGMKPVQLQSAADFKKSITTESKVFSIYAVGVKKGYRRETRVKVMAVTDFRSTPSPTQIATAALAGATGTTPSPTGSAATPAPSASANPAQAQADALATAVAQGTGGSVVYFRVE